MTREYRLCLVEQSSAKLVWLNSIAVEIKAFIYRTNIIRMDFYSMRYSLLSIIIQLILD